MSATASWTYTNVCTVYPLDTSDDWENSTRYGAPYLINATWEATSTERASDYGEEAGKQYTIYTESKYQDVIVRLPQANDYITLGDATAQPDPVLAGADKILTVLNNDMSFFSEDPDYEISTFRKWQGG